MKVYSVICDKVLLAMARKMHDSQSSSTAIWVEKQSSSRPGSSHSLYSYMVDSDEEREYGIRYTSPSNRTFSFSSTSSRSEPPSEPPSPRPSHRSERVSEPHPRREPKAVRVCPQEYLSDHSGSDYYHHHRESPELPPANHHDYRPASTEQENFYPHHRYSGQDDVPLHCRQRERSGHDHRRPEYNHARPEHDNRRSERRYPYPEHDYHRSDHHNNRPEHHHSRPEHHNNRPEHDYHHTGRHVPPPNPDQPPRGVIRQYERMGPNSLRLIRSQETKFVPETQSWQMDGMQKVYGPPVAEQPMCGRHRYEPPPSPSASTYSSTMPGDDPMAREVPVHFHEDEEEEYFARRRPQPQPQPRARPAWW